jgi:hypothetical protein
MTGPPCWTGTGRPVVSNDDGLGRRHLDVHITWFGWEHPVFVHTTG